MKMTYGDFHILAFFILMLDQELRLVSHYTDWRDCNVFSDPDNYHKVIERVKYASTR